MKKLFVLILSFAFSLSFAQNISWNSTYDVEESLFNSFFGTCGDYIGEINNSQFFVFYRLKSQYNTSDDIMFSVIKVHNNQVIQSTEFFKKKYNILKFIIFEEQIGVIYLDDSLNDKHHICIDTYNPNTLQFIKKTQIYSFKPLFGKGNLKNIAISDDKSKIAIFAYSVNPDDNLPCLLLKVFDSDFNELYENYFIYEYESYNKFGDFCVTNNGTVLLNINCFTDVYKDNVLKNIYLYMFSGNNVKKIEYNTEGNVAYPDIKFLPDQNNPAASHLVLTESDKINIHALNFKIETIDDPITYDLPVGAWKVDKICSLANGNLVFALSNRGIVYVASQSGTGYVYWNKHLHFLCLDSRNFDIVYKQNLIRNYYQLESYLNPNGNMYISPFYFVNQNTFSLIYNTEEDLSNEDELKMIESKATKQPITKMAVIDETGKMTDRLLFNSVDEKGIFVPNFTYADSNLKINICKVKKKKITFGVLNN